MQKAVKLALFITVLFVGQTYGEEDGCNKDCKCLDFSITCNTPHFTLQLNNSTLKILCKKNMSANGLEAVNGLLNGQTEIVDLRLDACALNDKPLKDIINKIDKLKSLAVVGSKRYNYTITTMLQDLDQIENLKLINVGLKPGDLSFEQMKSLTLLNLSRNNFTELPVLNADTKKSLIHLNMSYNNLTTDVSEHIHLLTGLHILDLSGNPGIKIHSQSFNEFPSLTELHLANLGILKFNFESLSKMEQLSVINLSANGLKNISTDDLIYSWNGLGDQNISINLSNNKIHTIAAGNRTFSSIVKTIKDLDLSGNSLSNIDTKVLDVLNATKFVFQLKMGGNPWKCDCGFKNMSHFLKQNSTKTKVVDLDAMKCSSGNVSVKDLTDYILCPGSSLHVLVWITGFTVVIIVLVIANFVYKRTRRNQYTT